MYQTTIEIEAAEVDTVAVLQDLAQVNIDCREGCQEVAYKFRDVVVSNLCREMALIHNANFWELCTLLGSNTKPPLVDHPAAPGRFRLLSEVRKVLQDAPSRLLTEIDRAEQFAESRYDHALRNLRDAPITALLRRQGTAIVAKHDCVHELLEPTLAADGAN